MAAAREIDLKRKKEEIGGILLGNIQKHIDLLTEYDHTH